MSRTTTSITLTAAAAAGLCLLAAAPAAAQGFPNKQITLIVPFAAGGPSDVIGRLVAEHMGRTLGQQVIVENVAGAGGTAGASRLATAAPDGYTILIHHLALKAAPALYNNLRYDTATAFEPLGMINTGPMVITGKMALPPQNARDFFAYARSQGDKLTMAHAGVGSNSHLCIILMSQAVGAKPTQVAYRGTGPAMNDLVGGQVDALCDQSTTAVPQVQGGKIRAYAVTSAERLDVIKDVPTSREAGTPVEMTIWHGLYAPKGTPAEAIARLSTALQAAMKDPAVNERFASFGTTSFPESQRTPAAHKAAFEGEVAKWAKALREAGVAAGAVN
ncbi:MAG: tripartite tricarboxylate transporter substrate binding protein BugD [Bosea sp.]|jgi:tripartite-type tricarboxylate transporter receptor subunit TctC|nr:tripartite tricarboxylate transporter substrate binding protein BugD [Bosea sp. (in: a-proteobacteria)]